MIEVDVPQDVEQFARNCVADGRFSNLGDVVTAALQLLEREYTKKAFVAMLEEAEAEAERDGWVSTEQMDAELDKILEEARQQRR
ncbi:MAG TPA: type II toxin-antitoxin system ParD family antitoxin [Acidisphaera sp.]|nr:type II toxin-antitoxin system ParD family antitoxin [Acidisphaera sp.]